MPGRPSLFNDHVLSILTQIISQTGRSDSAAAELAGISTSTVSRWKQDHPELILELLRAREHFRERQLQIIHEASHQRAGWRAAAWLLERIFPEDYSPRAAEREKFIRLAEERRSSPDAHGTTHPHPQPPEPGAGPSTSLSASQNSQNPPPPTSAPSSAFVSASQNSQNSSVVPTCGHAAPILHAEPPVLREILASRPRSVAAARPAAQPLTGSIHPSHRSAA